MSNMLNDLLTDNETLVAVARQNWRAWPQARDAVVVTTNRLLFVRRHWFGGMAMQDLLWQDAEVDVTLRQRMFSSTVSCGDLVMRRLNKSEARALYRKAQQMEQEWKERVRVRRMEEDYAKAGGVRLNMSPALDMKQLPAGRIGLQELDEMLKAGEINEAEYQAKRSGIINAM